MRKTIHFFLLTFIITACLLLSGCPGDTDKPPDDATPTPGDTEAPTATPTEAPTSPPSPTLESEFILGEWVRNDLTYPNSRVFDFIDDGTCDVYSNYDMSGTPSAISYTFTASTLTFNGVDYQVTIVGDNHFWVYSPTKDSVKATVGAEYDYYRISTEPLGYVFDNTPTIISTLDTWVVGSTSVLGDGVLYSFTAPDAGYYRFNWDDAKDGSATYSLDVLASFYRADQSTAIYFDLDSGYSGSILIELTQNETIYLVFTPFNNSTSGDFAVRIQAI